MGGLDGVRVIDCATVLAGPGAATRLADFGADVIKVEHPRTGDTTRALGWTVDGVGLLWKQAGRNKRPVTLDLSKSRGRDLFLRLVATADVVVESFRPGTLERWGLGPDALLEVNPGLVLLRTSGFGQTGPYRERPGFGTIAEAMSGFAGMNGDPDGPPVLPPIALADEVAAVLGAFALMVALYHRDVHDGTGQVIDLSLFEPLFGVVGPIAAVYDKLGVEVERAGSRIAYAAPRSCYATADGRFVALSGSSQSIAERLFRAIGRPELVLDRRFASNAARVQHVEELDRIVGDWIGERTAAEAMAAFESHGVAAAPVYGVRDILEDPQYAARGTLVRVPDDELGDVLLPDVQPRLSATPGEIRHPGLPLGAANADVYGELGLDAKELAALGEDGVI